jgi:cytidylate kinase
MTDQLKPYWIGPQYSEIGLDWEIPFLARRKLPTVVGLTGPTRVGKTMVAKRLVTEHGFHYESISAVLGEMAMMLGSEGRNWRALGEVGRTLRKEMGLDILAQAVLGRIYKLKDVEFIVVDGVLHPAEARTFSAKTNFVLVGLVASTQARVTEALRWYTGKEKEIRQDLRQRDKFENYDYEAFERIRRSENNLDEYKAEDVHAPDVLACLALVEKEYLIDLGNDPFNAKTMFDPTDWIVRGPLKRISDEYR